MLILWMWNVKFYHKTFFNILFIQTKIMNKLNKANKWLKFMKVFSLPVGMWNSKSCQFHAAHASFILIMLFLALKRMVITEVSKYKLLETILSWFSSYITFCASFDQFSGRHRDLWRQIGPIRRQDFLQSYNKGYWQLITLSLIDFSLTVKAAT